MPDRSRDANGGNLPAVERRSRALRSAAFGVLVVVVALIVGWGFTVDDALISTRVAYHLREGAGYRFNPDGPVVDCVTPLGWAFVLAPGSVEPWVGLQFARWLGVLFTLGTGAVLGALLRDVNKWAFFFNLLPLAACLPFGAWSVSGMETALVTLLVTLSLAKHRLALWCLTLAAALRPEMIPFAFVLSALLPVDAPHGRPAVVRARRVAVALSLPLAAALVRQFVFGHAAPLAVFAKPSDFDSGLGYAVSGLFWLGLPVLLVAPRAFRRQPACVRAVALAVLAHWCSVVVAGGDWMALFRLFVPVAPVLCWLGARLSNASSPWAVSVRGVVAIAVCLLLFSQKGPAARGVWSHRVALSAQVRHLIEHSFRVATLDVGWVGATTRAPLVDLAGVTDIEVALLPGGHTSKRLPADFLLRRDPDTLIVLTAQGVSASDAASLPWTEVPLARTVEQHLQRLDGANDYVTVGSVALGGTTQRYVIARRLSNRFAAR